LRWRLLVRHHAASAAAGIHSAHQSVSGGIYAEGIVESDQPSGENINIYPEVAGTVKQILVAEGQEVRKGAPLLLLIDDSIERATVEQQHSQWQAALTLLDELRAQPRKENLDVAKAQVDAAHSVFEDRSG
jgi:HlyD family secretion protein